MGSQAGLPDGTGADRQEEPQPVEQSGPWAVERSVPVSRPVSKPRQAAHLLKNSLLNGSLLGPLQVILLTLLIFLSLTFGALGVALFQPFLIEPGEISFGILFLTAAALLAVVLFFSASLRLAIDRKIIRRIKKLTEKIDNFGQAEARPPDPAQPDDEITQAAVLLDDLSRAWYLRQAENQEQSLSARRELSELRQSEAAHRTQIQELNQQVERHQGELKSEAHRRQQIEANLRSNLDTMVLLYHITTITTTTHDPQKAMEALCRELAVVLDLPQAAYAELAPDRKSLTVSAEYRQEGRPSALGMVIPVKDNAATQKVLQTRQPLVIQYAQNDPRQEVIHHLERVRGTVSLLIMPIIVRGEVIGTLGLDAIEAREFTPEEIALVQNCATGLAQALDNLSLYNTLQKELADKRKVEQDLRDSEARYRQSVENSPMPIFITDRSGAITMWSRTSERVFQVGQEALGIDFAALLAQPLDRERLGGLVRQVFDACRSMNDIDILYRCKDGSARYMVTRMYPLTNREGRVSGCVFANADLTERKRAEDEIRKRTLQLEVLRKASLELTAELDLETLLSRVADRSRELLGADRSGIYVYNKETDSLEFRVRSGESSPPLGLVLKRGEGLAGRVLETRNPLMVDDYSGWEGHSDKLTSYLIGAMIGVPVTWRDEMLGVLIVASAASHRFTRSDIELLDLFAHQAAIAIRNARVMTEEERQRRRAEAMARAAADLSSTLEIKPLLEIAVHSAGAAFPQADFGMILIHHPALEGGYPPTDEAQLPPFAVFGLSQEEPGPTCWTGERLAEIETVWKRVFQDGTPVLFSGLERTRWGEPLSEIQSAIGVPLKLRERVTGILWLGSTKEKGAFLSEDLSLLEALANQTAIAVENANLYRQARLSEEALRHEALHDPLTGLPNRIFFLDKLRQSIERIRRATRQTNSLKEAKQAEPSRHIAVLFLDLDRFKVINDSLGHAAGDRLLIEVAGRLADSLRPGDTVARFGGDEFAVLLENLQTPGEEAKTASAILEVIAQPIKVNQHEVSTTASLGIALTGGVKRSADEMLREADIAMYHAKANGKARWDYYRPELDTRTVSALELESDLRRALAEQELLLVYQPVVDLRTGECVEMEELLRWPHPKRGLLLPEVFLPVAVETGLMSQIGKWVVQEAIRQQRSWDRAEKPVPVAVNLPARQLWNESILNQVETLILEEKLAPGSLALDIGEPDSEQDCQRLGEVFRRLRQAGIWINLEHFGSGGSSFSILKHLPIDGLKIPRELVGDLPGSPQDIAVVEALVRMGHALGLVVTAVGVETEEQADCLRSMGCDRAQGKWASEPVSPEQA